MFEFQVRHKRFSSDHLPREVKVLFKDFDADITATSLLVWEEHCTECAMPQCFLTYDLYEMRSDGKCRRFIDGISPISDVPNAQGYIVRVSFKRWAKLMARGRMHMVPIDRVKMVEKFFRGIDTFVARIPDHKIPIVWRRGRLSRLTGRLKKYITEKAVFCDYYLSRSDYFLAEAYNPARKTANLSLVIRNRKGEMSTFPFQQLLSVEPGFNRFKIDWRDMSDRLDINDELEITLSPNILKKEDEGPVLYFGTIAFACDNNYRAKNTVFRENPHEKTAFPLKTTDIEKKNRKTVKVVAWDLDNTIWDGILVEDGPENLSLKPEIKQILVELDTKEAL